jgi:hypothetical protein
MSFTKIFSRRPCLLHHTFTATSALNLVMGKLPAHHNLRGLPSCPLILALSSARLSCYKFHPTVAGEGAVRGLGQHLPTPDYSISSLGMMQYEVQSTKIFRVRYRPVERNDIPRQQIESSVFFPS